MKVKVIRSLLETMEEEISDALKHVPGRFLGMSQLVETEQIQGKSGHAIHDVRVIYTTIMYKG